VNLLDFSCADEVVAKLLLRYGRGAPPQDAYFILRGVRDDHLDAIEAVLERHQLALVIQTDDGAPALVGCLDDTLRRAWHALHEIGRGVPQAVADALGTEPTATARLLDALHERRLVMQLDGEYVALGGIG
jgi:hypothetical protein